MNRDIDKPLRILMVIPRLQSGGAERQLGYLSHGLEKLGHEVVVATLGESGTPPPGWSRTVQLHRLRGRSNYDPRLLFQLIRLIRSISPDIVHTWNPQTDILGGIAALLNSCLWMIREPSCADFYRSGWKGKIRARLAVKAAAIISNSAGGDAYWRSLYPAKRRYVISNCLPLDLISQTQPVSRREVGVKEGQMMLLYAGRLIRLKRVDLIIAAMKTLSLEVNAVLFICGDGDESGELRAQAQRLGIEDLVKFSGIVKPETVWAMMKSSDLFINISEFEGMPNTVMEAMACGCPILASDIPAHREILDEQTACFVSTQDVVAVTKELTSLLSLQAAESKKARALAAERIARSWSIEAMAKQYEGIYNSILSRPEDDLER